MYPFEEGFDAFWAGISQDRNPYLNNEDAEDAEAEWDNGWLEAEAEDEEND